eukprot:6190527-Pleurochrysis_carterae.AAC.3
MDFFRASKSPTHASSSFEYVTGDLVYACLQQLEHGLRQDAKKLEEMLQHKRNAYAHLEKERDELRQQNMELLREKQAEELRQLVARQHASRETMLVLRAPETDAAELEQERVEEAEIEQEEGKDEEAFAEEAQQDAAEVEKADEEELQSLSQQHGCFSQTLRSHEWVETRPSQPMPQVSHKPVSVPSAARQERVSSQGSVSAAAMFASAASARCCVSASASSRRRSISPNRRALLHNVEESKPALPEPKSSAPQSAIDVELYKSRSGDRGKTRASDGALSSKNPEWANGTDALHGTANKSTVAKAKPSVGIAADLAQNGPTQKRRKAAPTNTSLQVRFPAPCNLCTFADVLACICLLLYVDRGL